MKSLFLDGTEPVDDIQTSCFQITEVNVAASANRGEQYASTTFKATVKFANKFKNDNMIKLFVKMVVPKVNAFSDGNSYDTGEENF